MRVEHELKTHPEPFQAAWEGRKRFELRFEGDRTFREGDQLYLREWDLSPGGYTGRIIMVPIEYVLHGPAFGLPARYCIMSLGLEMMRGEGPVEAQERRGDGS
jgi:hypothetical protein